MFHGLFSGKYKIWFKFHGHAVINLYPDYQAFNHWHQDSYKKFLFFFKFSSRKILYEKWIVWIHSNQRRWNKLYPKIKTEWWKDLGAFKKLPIRISTRNGYLDDWRWPTSSEWSYPRHEIFHQWLLKTLISQSLLTHQYLEIKFQICIYFMFSYNRELYY